MTAGHRSVRTASRQDIDLTPSSRPLSPVQLLRLAALLRHLAQRHQTTAAPSSRAVRRPHLPRGRLWPLRRPRRPIVDVFGSDDNDGFGQITFCAACADRALPPEYSQRDRSGCSCPYGGTAQASATCGYCSAVQTSLTSTSAPPTPTQPLSLRSQSGHQMSLIRLVDVAAYLSSPDSEQLILRPDANDAPPAAAEPLRLMEWRHHEQRAASAAASYTGYHQRSAAERQRCQCRGLGQFAMDQGDGGPPSLLRRQLATRLTLVNTSIPRRLRPAETICGARRPIHGHRPGTLAPVVVVVVSAVRRGLLSLQKNDQDPFANLWS